MKNSKSHNEELEQQSGSIFSQQWNLVDGTDELPLKNVSITAILCLIGGILSFSLYFSLYFSFVPAITLLLAIVASVRMKLGDGSLLGWKAVLIGLGLAILFSVAVPLHHEIYRSRLKEDAKKYFHHWCSTIQQGDYLRVKQLSHVPHFLTLDTTEAAYWRQYLGEEESHSGLHRFLTDPLLLTLAALGDKATYSYYRTDLLHIGKESEEVVMTFAVTYPTEKNEKETFFIRLNGSRAKDTKRNLAIWKGGDKVKGPLPIDENGVPVSETK